MHDYWPAASDSMYESDLIKAVGKDNRYVEPSASLHICTSQHWLILEICIKTARNSSILQTTCSCTFII